MKCVMLVCISISLFLSKYFFGNHQPQESGYDYVRPKFRIRSADRDSALQELRGIPNCVQASYEQDSNRIVVGLQFQQGIQGSLFQLKKDVVFYRNEWVRKVKQEGCRWLVFECRVLISEQCFCLLTFRFDLLQNTDTPAFDFKRFDNRTELYDTPARQEQYNVL